MFRHLRTLLVLVVASCGILNASIIFTLGNHPQPGEANILLNSGGTGTMVTGTPNGFPSFAVNFTSTETLAEPSSGQARITDDVIGVPLTNLMIALALGTYGDLIINPFIGGCATCAGGTATITVNSVDSGGNPEAPSTFTYTIDNGDNFLTIVASGGERITSTSIDNPGGFDDLRQPRISGLGLSTTVPEPGTSVLLLFGLASVAAGCLRRSRADRR